VETYWLASISLYTIIDDGMQLEKVFMARMQKFAVTLYHEGDLSYFESINKETLKNAQLILQEHGVIERVTEDKAVLIIIDQDYKKDDCSKLRDFVERLGKFRREGKHRRDTENASNRTLKLANLAASSKL